MEGQGPEGAGRVLLGVCGGIAAYKAAELASLLVKQGMDVRVVMTPAAVKFIAPLTFAALTGNPVGVEMFDPSREADISHIELARWARVVVVAPATADFLARAAMGMGDDLLSTLLLATSAPLVLAPAMNPHMFAHPAVSQNLETLARRGALVVGPAAGRTACGEEGPGRMAEPAEIAAALVAAMATRDLSGVRLVVSAGPTREHLDPVRYLSNPSSGRMGVELARAARDRGAEVVLVLGPTHVEPPSGVAVERVVSAAEMHAAVLRAAEGAKVVIKAAAVSDWRPVDCAPQKVKKHDCESVCRLEPTVDILAELGTAKAGRVLVGFAAETEELMQNATAKLRSKNLDLIVANDVSAPDSGFSVETNRVHILAPDREPQTLPLMPKYQVAHLVLDRVAELLSGAP